MKRAVYILSLIAALAAFIASPLTAQDWQLVNSGVTDNLYDIFFIDKTTGWAVGADSTIIKTTDEGYTWFRQTGGVAEEYRCVYFRNPLLGWIGGTGGSVLHTTDGGESWVRQETEGITVVNNFDFVNDSTGWLAASDEPCGSWRCDGAILKTTNGGDEWNTSLHTPIIDDQGRIDSIFIGFFHSVDFINDTMGCAVGDIFSDRGYNNGSLIFTRDGGITWHHKINWTAWSANYAVKMIDENTYVVGGRWGLVSTDDSFADFKYYEPTVFVNDMYAFDYRDIFLLGTRDSLVRVVHYNPYSNDPLFQYLEGVSKVPITSINPENMGIFMLDTATGWVCGDSGKLWRRPAVIDGITPLPAPGNLYVAIESVYPNPLALYAHSTATVRFSVHRESVLAFEVRDVLGRVVFRKNDGTPYTPGMHEETMPLHGLRAGMYFVSARSARGTGGNIIVFIR